jgi:hypothetical protein
MSMTEEVALRAYAKMINTLDFGGFGNILTQKFSYQYQTNLRKLKSKNEFLAYTILQFEKISKSNIPVFAEMGMINVDGNNQPCAILAQGNKENIVAYVVATVTKTKLSGLEQCIYPAPTTAERSGDYPIVD